MRDPLNGLLSPYSARSAIRPGISVSAMFSSLRPNSASAMSFTIKSVLIGLSYRFESRLSQAYVSHKNEHRLAVRPAAIGQETANGLYAQRFKGGVF